MKNKRNGGFIQFKIIQSAWTNALWFCAKEMEINIARWRKWAEKWHYCTLMQHSLIEPTHLHHTMQVSMFCQK